MQTSYYALDEVLHGKEAYKIDIYRQYDAFKNGIVLLYIWVYIYVYINLG